jgi:hypothetical protein
LKRFAGPAPKWRVDDLARICGLTGDALRNGPDKADLRTIATADGLVTIAPYYIAPRIFGAMTGPTIDILPACVQAFLEACEKLMPVDNPLELIEWIEAAKKRHERASDTIEWSQQGQENPFETIH